MACAGHLGERRGERPLHRVVEADIAFDREAGVGGEGEEARMFARAVVVDGPRLLASEDQALFVVAQGRPLGAAFQALRRQTGGGQHLAGGRDMHRLAIVRGAGECDVALGEAEAVGGAAFHQRQRLKRLDRRTGKGRPLGLAMDGDQRAAGIGDDNVDAVAALDKRAAGDLNDGGGKVLHRCLSGSLHDVSAVAAGRAIVTAKASGATVPSSRRHRPASARIRRKPSNNHAETASGRAVPPAPPAHLLRHRIVAGSPPRIAARDPHGGEPAAGKEAVAGDRLIGEFGTGRLVTAGIADEARQGELVEANEADAGEAARRPRPRSGIVAALQMAMTHRLQAA